MYSVSPTFCFADLTCKPKQLQLSMYNKKLNALLLSSNRKPNRKHLFSFYRYIYSQVVQSPLNSNLYRSSLSCAYISFFFVLINVGFHCPKSKYIMCIRFFFFFFLSDLYWHTYYITWSTRITYRVITYSYCVVTCLIANTSIFLSFFLVKKKNKDQSSYFDSSILKIKYIF